MSKALRCDRCGDFFDPSEIEDDRFFITFDCIKEQTSAEYLNNTRTLFIGDDPINHLCPACSEKFKKWFFVKKDDEEKEDMYDLAQKAIRNYMDNNRRQFDRVYDLRNSVFGDRG